MSTNNPLKTKIRATAQLLEEMSFDLAHEFKKIEDEYDDLLEELQDLTESLLPGAQVGQLDDDEMEFLAENKEWADLNARFEYLDERYKISEKIRNILSKAANSVYDLE